MAFPTIAFNSTGSDSNSGDNTVSAITGSLAATHTNTTVNITDAVNLGSVPVDGTAALRVASSSGRQWARITNITGSSGNWVVTTAEAYANTESGRGWGIGGKLLTMDGCTQFGLDARGGWTMDVQTDQTLTVNFRLTPNDVDGSPFTVTSTVGTRATKIQTATNAIFGLDVNNGNSIVVSNLYLKCTAGTPGTGIGLVSGNACTNIIIKNCLFDGWKYHVSLGDAADNARMQTVLIQGCEMKNATRNAIFNNISGTFTVADCYIHDNGSASSGSTVYPAIGKDTLGIGNCGIICQRTIFANNQGPGIFVILNDPGNLNAITYPVDITHCDFYKNCALGGATAGVMGELHINVSGETPVFVENCIFYGASSGNFAVKLSTGAITLYLANNNAYGVFTTNTSGTGLGNGSSPVTLTGDPFTSGTDFKLNSTSGAGAACKNAGNQGIPNATAGTDKPDIGAIQTQVLPTASGELVNAGLVGSGGGM